MPKRQDRRLPAARTTTDKVRYRSSRRGRWAARPFLRVADDALGVEPRFPERDFLPNGASAVPHFPLEIDCGSSSGALPVARNAGVLAGYPLRVHRDGALNSMRSAIFILDGYVDVDLKLLERTHRGGGLDCQIQLMRPRSSLCTPVRSFRRPHMATGS